MKKVTIEFDEDSADEIISFINKLDELVIEVNRLICQLQEAAHDDQRDR